jgi:hypothetical protein
MFARRSIPKLSHSVPRVLLLRPPAFRYATHLVRQGSEKVVGGWLFLSAVGVLGMIVLGGYTRLTHSGLSMVDWHPYTKQYPNTAQ